jgi:hypothetical protein
MPIFGAALTTAVPPAGADSAQRFRAAMDSRDTMNPNSRASVIVRDQVEMPSAITPKTAYTIAEVRNLTTTHFTRVGNFALPRLGRIRLPSTAACIAVSG